MARQTGDILRRILLGEGTPGAREASGRWRQVPEDDHGDAASPLVLEAVQRIRELEESDYELDFGKLRMLSTQPGLAELLGFSPPTIRKALKYSGYDFISWKRRMLVRSAERWLREGRGPLSEWTEKMKVSSKSVYTLFLEETGLTPSQWKKQNAGGDGNPR